MQLKIITFNWHEPYICHLTHLGHQFFVVAPEMAPGQYRQWDSRMRPIPSECKLITSAQALEQLGEGYFDLALCHNVKDLIWLQKFDLPKLNVFHCRLSTEIALGNNAIDKKLYLEQLSPVLEGVHKVFISENKKKDWGLEGDVILHGIDPGLYGPYTGQRPEVLRVGNLLKEMDLARGFSLSEKLLEGFPAVTLGLNPTLPEARLSNGFRDLQEHYRNCRLYLNTTMEPYEDGYNLSLLEAMASGMPIVSYQNSTSPIVDGENGFISGNLDLLRGGIHSLLNDLSLSKRLGTAARETVLDQFSMPVFLNNWEQAIQTCLLTYLKNRGYGKGRDATPFHLRKRKNVLMDFVSHPATTAFYLERAFRQNHNVMTCGATINDEVKRQWDLGALNWPVEPQDFFRGSQDGIQKVLKELPSGWEPDFYLFIETGLSGIPEDLHTLNIPRVAYLIDTHIHLEKHLQLATHFDVVFLAQKEYLPQFEKAGIENVYWLPLGCDPEIHGKKKEIKKWDVGFVGSITPAHQRRKELLDRIGNRFDLHVERRFMDEMTQVFCESRIVFNNAIKNDLNMRVFEALCSGSFLITDKAFGLEEFFADGKHLALYTDENIEEVIQYYLDHPKEREDIARFGRQEVLERHTYSHRMDQMIQVLNHFHKEDSSNEKESSIHELDNNYYHHIRHDIVKLIPESSQCILEIGCGAGKTGKFLKEQKPIFYAGVELDPNSAREAEGNLDDVINGNIEALKLPYEEKSFDCIICADVLEHLIEPQAVLDKLKPLLKETGVLIASLPNVQFFGLLHHLVEGNWTYQDEGILDKTHLRFFTYKEMEKLFEGCGFQIEEVDETLDPQYQTYVQQNTNKLKVGKLIVNDLSPEELRRFFVFQYKLVVRPKIHCKGEASPSEDKGQLQKAIQKAQGQEKAGHLKEALQLYQELFKENPMEPAVLTGLGNGYFRSGEIEKGKEYFKKALQTDSGFVGASLGLGLAHFQQKDFKSATFHFNRILKSDPKNDKALSGMGLVHLNQGNFEKAKNSFIRALESNPENQTALTTLLKLAYQDRDFSPAEKALKAFLAYHPANLSLMFGLAGVLSEQMKIEECREVLDQILLFEPNHQDAKALHKKLKSLNTIP